VPRARCEYELSRGGRMDNQDTELRDRSERPVGYEPPRVVRVLTPEDLEREILYAGPLPY